ncbi:unnamed protein product [marine sediment metagenome]|uniref:Thioredoxin domain-containing protein n=1 Tax=marine sediment metagenome TaxID=412755 RepID=X1JEU8_9ZZZZ
MYVPKSIVALIVLVLIVVIVQVIRSRYSTGLQAHGSNAVTVQPGDYDLRGVYTYPGIGALFVPKNADGSPKRATLTLVIFFSAQTTCPASLSEIECYRRLVPVFSERGQVVMAVTSRADSAVVASFLKQERLDIYLHVSDSEDLEDGLTFDRMGLSPLFMPFKVLLDSTLTAIYMRGADNTPESQAEFESAVLWLSEKVSE